MKIYDAVVAGGGVAGASNALALARDGLAVLLVEASQGRVSKIGETLAPEARPVLVALGVWEEFEAAGHLPAPGKVSAWGSEQLEQHDFISSPHGSAWQLDRRGFESFLQRKAEEIGAQVLCGRPVTRLAWQRKRWRIEVSGDEFESRWIIDATGRGSHLARQVGTKRKTIDRLVSIHTRSSERERPDVDARTFLESQRHGWWYSALVPDGSRVIAYQTDANRLLPPRRSGLEWLHERVGETRHLQALLAEKGYCFTAPPKVVSAHSSKLEQAAGPGWLAVGDAAASFDPLSGQGLFNALLSGVKAAKVVVLGNDEAAKEYDRWYEGLWNRYIRDRRYFYSMEDRWSASPFWKARRDWRND